MDAQRTMRVSFDLDEVLFVSPLDHKIEKEPRFPLNLFYKERLRLGAPDLIRRLQQMGVEVWVYTSSYRTEAYITGLFRLYHVKFDGIINAQRHNREVQQGRKELLPQKMPNRYQISLHVDDESVIASYGKAFGFEVFELNAQDDLWEEKILERVEKIRAKMEREQTFLLSKE